MSRRFDGGLGIRAVELAGVAAVLSLGALPLRAASAPAHGGVRSYATGAGPVSVAAGDLNGDGKPDFVTANLYANTISVFVNRGGGRFKSRRDSELEATLVRWRSAT